MPIDFKEIGLWSFCRGGHRLVSGASKASSSKVDVVSGGKSVVVTPSVTLPNRKILSFIKLMTR